MRVSSLSPMRPAKRRGAAGICRARANRPIARSLPSNRYHIKFLIVASLHRSRRDDLDPSKSPRRHPRCATALEPIPWVFGWLTDPFNAHHATHCLRRDAAGKRAAVVRPCGPVQCGGHNLESRAGVREENVATAAWRCNFLDR
jgi:hypothetical protein